MKFKEDIDALILGCLISGPAHGYEISKRIRQLSNEVLTVAEGKLYPALHLLEAAEDITASWIPQGNRPPRKVYEITEQGKMSLESKRRQWRSFVEGVGTVIGGTADQSRCWSRR